MALQHRKPDLLPDDEFAEVRGYLAEHKLRPDDEPTILAAIRQRGWELEITGTAGDWEIEIVEPGASGLLQAAVVQDTDRQRALLRALDLTLWTLTTE